MTTYVLYNAKGGVGKTTSAVNLSYLDVIPADISARKLDIYLHDVKGSKR